MLGNWSFGDYFKKEAIDWAWELVVGIWKFPPQRLYATVYSPDKSKNDPSEFDQEAWNFWAEKFRAAGLDPKTHIVNGNKKDNFWMMGETGPCGPCSELHVDLTPDGDTKGALVNQGDARCIEIWNLVFIQFNAQPRGGDASSPSGSAPGASQSLVEFVPLAQKHVDTGMGFERVTSIIQGTKNFTDFANAKISNYETDIFRPLFDELEKLSGKKYRSTLPGDAVARAPRWQESEPIKSSGECPNPDIIEVGQASSRSQTLEEDGDRQDACPTPEQIQIDVAFRVIADHIRTLGFAIADGIQPGNNDRNYVLRRILRRAVRYGRTLGFHEPFFYKLVDVLADTMGEVFPEIRAKKKHVQEVIRVEEEAFNKTLDKGIGLFEEEAKYIFGFDVGSSSIGYAVRREDEVSSEMISTGAILLDSEAEAKGISLEKRRELRRLRRERLAEKRRMDGTFAFRLYDEQGFPLDLTELMARERGLTVDKIGFEKLMEEQRARARAAQKKEVISLSQIETTTPTKFVGYDNLSVDAKVVEVVSMKDKTAVILNTSACYAEMGGQVGDTGKLIGSGNLWRISNTQKSGNTWLHFIEGGDVPAVGAGVTLAVDKSRRDAIQRHHTVTHLLHWALHEVASKEASQKGSFVGPDKLTFDFNSPSLTPQQVADIEKLVNEKILENAPVSWTEVPHADVKNRKDVMQFFGDKYGDTVRVVQIGGDAKKLNGYSMELCGGTHVRATGEIGLFRIVSEAAVAAGVRRIEAVAGLTAFDAMKLDRELVKTVSGKVNSPVHELEKKIESLLAHQKELERQIKSAQQREASNAAGELLARVQTLNGTPAIIHNVGGVDGDFLQATVDSLKGRFKGVIILGGAANGAVALVAAVSPDFTAKFPAGKIIQAIAPIVGGKGGGKPDHARGGGKDAGKLDEALARAKSLLGHIS
jgi:alanyl-tRNA synthetase